MLACICFGQYLVHLVPEFVWLMCISGALFLSHCYVGFEEKTGGFLIFLNFRVIITQNTFKQINLQVTFIASEYLL